MYIHTLCMRATKALASLRTCAGSLEPSLLVDAISTEIPYTGIYTLGKKLGNTLISFKLFSFWQNITFLFLYVIIMDCHTHTNKVLHCMLPDSKQQRHCMIYGYVEVI